MQERVHDLEPLNRADFPLTLTVLNLLVQKVGLCLEVELFEATLDGFCPHVGFEEHSVAVLDILEDGVFSL